VILASWGRSDPPEDTDPALPANARDAALLTNARAARAVIEHDDSAAASAFNEFLSRHPTTDRFGERHLRRFPALGYVLDARLRRVWDEAPLGPSHEQARSIARLLLETRRGCRPRSDDLSPPVVLTVLPLPWSVELACRLHGLGSAQGATLAAWLVDQIGNEARRELRRVAACPRSDYARPASALLSHLPAAPDHRLEIGVLGPLEVRVDGAPAERPELRRQRVRELLTVLVVERTITRDRAVDLLWPELDAEAGSRNLRVTLAHLRHLLEPDRPAGEASFHLRCDATTIALFRSSKLVVDLWELERLAADAARARLDGSADRAVELLDTATASWRGRPLSDLDRLVGFEIAIEHAQSLQLASLLTAGELRLTQGAAAEAASLAERALLLDPYLEAAHRLAIAAHDQRRDSAGTSAALARAERAFEDLGVEPEPATRIVMRHAAGWGQLTAAAGVAR
jgi:DNA-binding SARP family transcriptional activator